MKELELTEEQLDEFDSLFSELHKKFSCKRDKSLWHYTSLEAGLSILSGCSLWLSNFRYLNDNEEILRGSNYVRNKINDLLTDNSFNNLDKDKIIKGYKNLIDKGFQPFITCVQRILIPK